VHRGKKLYKKEKEKRKYQKKSITASYSGANFEGNIVPEAAKVINRFS